MVRGFLGSLLLLQAIEVMAEFGLHRFAAFGGPAEFMGDLEGGLARVGGEWAAGLVERADSDHVRARLDDPAREFGRIVKRKQRSNADADAEPRFDELEQRR